MPLLLDSIRRSMGRVLQHIPRRFLVLATVRGDGLTHRPPLVGQLWFLRCCGERSRRQRNPRSRRLGCVIEGMPSLCATTVFIGRRKHKVSTIADPHCSPTTTIPELVNTSISVEATIGWSSTTNAFNGWSGSLATLVRTRTKPEG